MQGDGESATGPTLKVTGCGDGGGVGWGDGLSLWNTLRGEGTCQVSTIGCTFTFASSCWPLGISVGVSLPLDRDRRKMEEMEVSMDGQECSHSPCCPGNE